MFGNSRAVYILGTVVSSTQEEGQGTAFVICPKAPGTMVSIIFSITQYPLLSLNNMPIHCCHAHHTKH